MMVPKMAKEQVTKVTPELEKLRIDAQMKLFNKVISDEEADVAIMVFNSAAILAGLPAITMTTRKQNLFIR